MKTFLPLLLAAGLLFSGCSKSKDDPQPSAKVATASLLGTWTFQQQSKLTAPKSGATATTAVEPIAAGSYKTAFAGDGSYTIVGNGSTATGRYTYAALTLTFLDLPTTGQSVATTVTELTANRLVYAGQTEDASNRYTTTVTYTR